MQSAYHPNGWFVACIWIWYNLYVLKSVRLLFLPIAAAAFTATAFAKPDAADAGAEYFATTGQVLSIFMHEGIRKMYVTDGSKIDYFADAPTASGVRQGDVIALFGTTF